MNKTLVKGSDGKTYQVVNGTFYHEKTPEAVIKWLETSRVRRQRIRNFYGDAETGRDWMNEYDVLGIVGRSTGDIKIPLLIANSRSHGGGGILDHCIVRIATKDASGRLVDVYKHPHYRLPSFKIREVPHGRFEVMADNVTEARFDAGERAERWISFIRGERWTTGGVTRN